MKRKDRVAIEEYVKGLSNDELEAEYYKAVYDCLGSQTEDMYELGYDIQDILECEKYEQYLCDRADILEYCCMQRGIELWKEYK